MEELMYEEERLLLHVQEAIAEAITKSGLKNKEIADRLDKNRSFVTQALSSGRNLTLASIAGLAWASGFRIRPELEALDKEAARVSPSSVATRQAENTNDGNVIPISRSLYARRHAPKMIAAHPHREILANER